MSSAAGTGSARTVRRLDTPGGELALLERDGEYEIVLNGTFLMDTVGGGPGERALVRAALDRCDQPRRIAVLGLGVGYSLAEAVAEPALDLIEVVEREPAVVAWQRSHLGARLGNPIDDPRVRVMVAPAQRWLAEAAAPDTAAPDMRDAPRFDVVCVDTDNGPNWLATDDNAGLYTPEALAAFGRVLRPGGVLAVWSAHEAPGFVDLLRAAGFVDVETVAVPIVVRRGPPDIIYLARATPTDLLIRT
jgi:spermidine synthase